MAEGFGLSPDPLRSVVCRVLLRLPHRSNWSEYPNIWDEVIGLIETCQWYRVYDIAEAVWDALTRRQPRDAAQFEQELNKVFIEHGIGWQMIKGQILAREEEATEKVVEQAVQALDDSEYASAARELREARLDLSRRPDPDLTGCLHHCMAALECLCRELSGQPKLTLGEILKQHNSELSIPKPLDEAIIKAWGYASEVVRHVAEGKSPGRNEVTLVLGMVASIITYLMADAD